MGPRAKKTSFVVALAAALTLACATEGCRSATQMELDVTYGGPCKDLHGVAFIVSTDPYAAESRIETNVFTTTTADCTQITPELARVGTLVLTPSDTTDHTSLVVLAGFGIPVEQCKAEMGYFGCIVARRSFTFVPHTGLTLNISLDPDCLNVPCSAVSTCSHKSCVDSNVECSADGCGAVGVSSDGGIATVDAPTSSDAYVQQLDGPNEPTDAPIDGTITDAGPDTSDAGACQMPKTGLTCLVGAVEKTCNPGDHCCSGFSFGDGGTDGGFMQQYDCRGGGCMVDQGHPDIACKNAKNCPAGTVCCLSSFPGAAPICMTSCGGGMPDGAFQPMQLCADDCECLNGGHCGMPFTIGANAAQPVKKCF